MEVLRRVRALRRRREKSLVEDTLDLHLPSSLPSAPSSIASAASRYLFPAGGGGFGAGSGSNGGGIGRGRSRSRGLLPGVWVLSLVGITLIVGRENHEKSFVSCRICFHFCLLFSLLHRQRHSPAGIL